MPPEMSHAVVALQFDFVNGTLHCRGERIFPVPGKLIKSSWYTASKATPADYMPILNGVIYVHRPSMNGMPSQTECFQITKVGDRYQWRDNAEKGGFMFVLVLPPGWGIIKSQPIPIEAKSFDGRLSVLWLLYPAPEEDSSSVTITWEMCTLAAELDREVERLNRQISLAKKRDQKTEYDVALSFAGEDRVYVDTVAQALRAKGITVFYDDFEKAKIWGENLVEYLDDIYRKKARFTVMFISKAYAQKRWTTFERQSAQARAFVDNRAYILPARFDDTELPGMLPTTAYVPLNSTSPAALAQLIIEKLESSK
jgi:hypothetical protein